MVKYTERGGREGWPGTQGGKKGQMVRYTGREGGMVRCIHRERGRDGQVHEKGRMVEYTGREGGIVRYTGRRGRKGGMVRYTGRNRGMEGWSGTYIYTVGVKRNSHLPSVQRNRQFRSIPV